MPNTHLRSLLAKARSYVETNGVIPYDHAVKMMSIGLDVPSLERNYRKEFGHD
jgi:hypothetical protein